MKLVIRIPTGKRLEIEADAADTVDRLKERIQEREGIPANQQRLLFSGNKLVGKESLTMYNIQEGSEIYLVLRLGGPPSRRSVTWERKIDKKDISDPNVPLVDARFTFTMADTAYFLTSSNRSNGQNLWRNYWTGPEYRFTDVVVPDWVVVLKLSPEFSSAETKDELKARLDAVRYNYQGINRSYYGGQSDSWQRYTTTLPIRISLRIGDLPNIFTVRVTEQLEPNTWYAVTFLNHFGRHPRVPSFYEDYLLPFKTAAPEPATLPVDALPPPPTPLQGTVHDAFLCPIGLGVMVDPVVCLDGHSDERVNIEH